MCRIISTATIPGDVVWEPFGGLCSALVAAVELGRDGYAAELVEHFADLAVERLKATSKQHLLANPNTVRMISVTRRSAVKAPTQAVE